MSPKCFCPFANRGKTCPCPPCQWWQPPSAQCSEPWALLMFLIRIYRNELNNLVGFPAISSYQGPVREDKLRCRALNRLKTWRGIGLQVLVVCPPVSGDLNGPHSGCSEEQREWATGLMHRKLFLMVTLWAMLSLQILGSMACVLYSTQVPNNIRGLEGPNQKFSIFSHKKLCAVPPKQVTVGFGVY